MRAGNKGSAKTRGNDLFAAALIRHQMGDLAGALTGYDAALRQDRRHADAHANRGVALAQLDRFDEAVASFDLALAHNPGHGLANQFRAVASADAANAHFERGVAQWTAGDAEAAVASIDSAIALGVGHGAAFNLRGMALHALGRRDAALADFDRAIALDPLVANPHLNRAEALESAGRFEDAVSSWERALALAPDLGWVQGRLMLARMRLCDWSAHDGALELLARPEVASQSNCAAFALLALTDDPMLHRRAAEAYLAAQCPAPAAPLPAYPRRERIRIGYFSADFYAHATMYLIADMLAAHDRDRFEIAAFSFGPDRVDAWQGRAQATVDHFIDVGKASDREIAERARAMEIDIAVDLKGLTGEARPGIFAARAAPLQINFLGYPGTMPAPFMDYIVADPILIPPAERSAYAERIITLPDSYQPNCRPSHDEPSAPRRAEVGLPEDAFVFCSFNQSYKITPAMFDLWLRILTEAENSVLWLWVEDEAARARLRQAAERASVRANRVVFAGSMPRADHLARLKCADLFLDTAPYGAHTTASDALLMGLPGLTCPGRSFASRVPASLFNAIGMSELICDTFDDYARRAVELSRLPGQLADLRRRLATNRATMPLFDPQRFTRHLERAYRAIFDRAQTGLAPEDIGIDAD